MLKGKYYQKGISNSTETAIIDIECATVIAKTSNINFIRSVNIII